MALPDYLQDTAKDFAKQLTATTSVPINTGTFTGRQFVAGEDPMQTQAINLATSGVGSYQPFLTAAQGAVQQQAGLTGPQAFQQFMSPFQQQVIDTTLQDFDRQAAMGRQGIRDQAFTAGAFGGGREGVQRAEYQSASDRNRAALQAQLLGQGFTQAQNLAQQDFLRNINLAQQSPALVGQQIAGLTTLGGQQQARQQQLLAADQQLAQRQAFQPLEAAERLGAGIVPLISGYPGREQTTIAPSPSPLQTGLSTGATLAGIYRLFKG